MNHTQFGKNVFKSICKCVVFPIKFQNATLCNYGNKYQYLIHEIVATKWVYICYPEEVLQQWIGLIGIFTSWSWDSPCTQEAELAGYEGILFDEPSCKENPWSQMERGSQLGSRQTVCTFYNFFIGIQLLWIVNITKNIAALTETFIPIGTVGLVIPSALRNMNKS